MPNIFGWLGTRQQREVLSLIPSHMEKVTRVVSLLREAMLAFIAGDPQGVQALHEEITAAEREADELRRELLQRLSEGFFVPADRTDLVHLVERMDTIADYANSASRLLMFFKGPAPEPLHENLQRVTDLLVQAVQALAQSLELLYEGKGADALQRCDQVETAEEQADQEKHLLLGTLYSLDLPATQLLPLHDLIESLENTADRAEDSADLVRVLAVNLR